MSMRLIGLLFLTVAVTADAKVITETRMMCEQELRAEPVNASTANVWARCITVDATGAIVRQSREYNVWNKLTAQQQTGVLNILAQLQSFAAQNETIPTPTPMSTP